MAPGGYSEPCRRRCESVQGSMRCVRQEQHDGPHIAPMSGNSAIRWGMVGIGCCDPECVRSANHTAPHRNGRGASWVPMDERDLDDADIFDFEASPQPDTGETSR